MYNLFKNMFHILNQILNMNTLGKKSKYKYIKTIIRLYNRTVVFICMLVENDQ